MAPGPSLNLIVGRNGSGKTSLLEAIYLLSTARSFRGGRSLEFIRRGQEFTRVVARVSDDEHREHQIGVERGRKLVRIRLGGETVRSSSALARQHPCLLITPESQGLFSDGPQERRRLIDWIVFHVEPTYATVNSRFKRALNQRNVVLRTQQDNRVLASWDEELGESGEQLAKLRHSCLGAWLMDTEFLMAELVGQQIKIVYQRGWDDARSLVAKLQETVSVDRQRGFTSRGPHRADLSMTVGGVPVHQALSRGEMKLCVIGLLLTQAMMLKQITGRVPLLLIDELASDLDQGNRQRILEAIVTLKAQAFVTAIDTSWSELTTKVDKKVFHVEQRVVYGDTMTQIQTDY